MALLSTKTVVSRFVIAVVCRSCYSVTAHCSPGFTTSTFTWWIIFVMSELTHSCWCPPSGRPYQFVSDMSTLSRWPGQGQSPHQTVRQQILNIFHLFVCHHWLTDCKHRFWSGRFMRERRPYELKYFVRGYNLFQTCLSFWGFTEGWK